MAGVAEYDAGVLMSIGNVPLGFEVFGIEIGEGLKLLQGFALVVDGAGKIAAAFPAENAGVGEAIGFIAAVLGGWIGGCQLAADGVGAESGIERAAEIGDIAGLFA